MSKDFKNGKYQISCQACNQEHDWDKDCDGNYIPRDNITKTFIPIHDYEIEAETRKLEESLKLDNLKIIQLLLIKQKEINILIEKLLEMEK